MFITDYIKVYETALPNDLCNELGSRFDASDELKDEYEAATEEGKPPLRSYQELVLSKGHQKFLDIQPVMMKITELAALKYQSEIPTKTFPKEIGCETFRLQKFRAGTEDRFQYHVDVSNYPSARRFLGMTWFLNDVEQGATFYFPHPNVRIQPKKGRMVIYPAMWLYPHAIDPSISEDCYTISTFLHYV